MNILAKTAGVMLAAAALCGLGVGTAAAATSGQASGTSSICTDIWAYWESKLNQESAEIDALILKIQQEEGSNPAQTQADYITLQKLINQYNSDEEEMSNQVAKCQQQKPGIIGTCAERKPGTGRRSRCTSSDGRGWAGGANLRHKTVRPARPLPGQSVRRRDRAYRLETIAPDFVADVRGRDLLASEHIRP